MHLAPKVMQTKLKNGLYDLVTTWRRHLELNMYWNDAMVELQYLAIQHLDGVYIECITLQTKYVQKKLNFEN